MVQAGVQVPKTLRLNLPLRNSDKSDTIKFMDAHKFESVLAVGETIAVEFKRCGGKPEADTYQTICAFLNRFGGDIYLGVEDVSVSLSNKISREMIVNCLMHREFTSSYIAQFVIEKDRMFTANANRAETGDTITPDNLRPNPKNPIIASFFRNIGLADELGSGVRNLYRYGKLYSGKEPQLIDGDVFRIIVPLDDNYSFDSQIGKAQNKAQSKRNNNCALNEAAVMEYMQKYPMATQIQIAEAVGKSRRTVQNTIAALKKRGLVVREGARMNGRWIVKQ